MSCVLTYVVHVQNIAAREAVTDAMIAAATQRDEARFSTAVAVHRLEHLAKVTCHIKLTMTKLGMYALDLLCLVIDMRSHDYPVPVLSA